MTLRTLKAVSESICLLAVAASAVYAVRDLHATQLQARASLAQIAQGVTSALNAINRPCGHGHPCGLLADADKAVVKAGDAIVTTQVQERAIVPAAVSAMRSLSGSADSLGSAANALAGTALAARGSADALTVDLRSLQGPVDASGSLLRAGTATVDTFNKRLADPRVDALLDSLQATSASASGIAADARRVADDATRKYFAPVPWYRKVLPYATTGAKIAAYALPWP